MRFKQATILGAGMLGFANARYMSERLPEIILYEIDPDVSSHIRETRMHKHHFSEIQLPNNVKITSNISDISKSGLIIVDIHSAGIRSTFRELRPYIKPGAVIVNDAKGLEANTHKLPLEIIHEEIEDATLIARSGWMLAKNIIEGKASYADIACRKQESAEEISRLTSSSTFYNRTSSDVTGVQLAGVMKNVYAILAGFFDGISQADAKGRKKYLQMKEAYMDAATAEAKMIGTALGGKPETFQKNSYAWGKDFYNSCTQQTSNRLLGEQIGLGMTPLEAFNHVLNKTSKKPEGYHALNELHLMAESKNINAPILSLIYSSFLKSTGPEQMLYKIKELIISD